MDAPDTIRSTRRRRLRQRSLLTVLGIVFAISAVLRIGTLDFAFAEAANDVSPDAARTPASTRTIDANLARGLQDAIAELEGLRLDLQRREAEISDRERAVATAQALVAQYAANEPEVLCRDFYNSLLAAFELDEVRQQLELAGLPRLEVRAVSDRHLLVSGRA